MIFFALISFTVCIYIELDSMTFKSHVGGDQAILVRFYSHRCIHCRDTAKIFEEASSYFDDDTVIFGEIDCLNYNQICDEFGITEYPTVALFKSKSKDMVNYDGSLTVNGILEFVQNNPIFQSRDVKNVIKELTLYTFEKYISSKKCGLVMFYDSSLKCKILLSQINEIAFAFEAESNVSIGAINCESYAGICKKYDFLTCPSFIFYNNNRTVSLENNRVRSFLDVVNEKCGVDRGFDGLLSANNGLIPEADLLIEHFLESMNKKEVIEKMKEIKSADFYVKVMERIVSNGIGKIRIDVQKMEQIMEERNVSFKTLDVLKRRYNIIQQFLKKAELAPTQSNTIKDIDTML